MTGERQLLQRFVALRHSLMADVISAHTARKDASQFMRENDANFLAQLSGLFNETENLLNTPETPNEA